MLNLQPINTVKIRGSGTLRIAECRDKMVKFYLCFKSEAFVLL